MEDFIRVVCRVRPPNSKEAGPACLNLRKSITIDNDSESLTIDTKPEPKSFAFDYVAREDTAQEEIFKQVGAPITEACLQGFNATIIAYGPTGTGKSYTIFGGNHDGQDAASSTNSQRGLVPRALEYIFQYLREHQEKDLDSVAAKVTTTAKCSFYEIYQERVYDLLDSNNCNASSSSSLQVREDSKRGIFVDGITEEIVNSSEEANQVLQNGYRNRHVGQTNMNRESSRSHAIFVLTLNINVEQENGTMKNRMSRFNLVDLAGSERQKDTQASGDRLKEASMINKSLSTLGNVINALSEKSSAKSRHINFRDSKLTFLLRDSLGGNTKTVLVATLSPSMGCVDETLSTLKFAQRAKNISSIVVRNEETTGSVLALQREIEALKAQLMSLSLPIRPAEEKLESESQSESKSMLPRLQDSGAQVATLLASLSSSLQRCQVLDEQRKRNEAGSAALTSRLEQNEKIVLGLEMKLKMRDSEIQRLKKSQPANADTENSEHCIEGLRSQLVDSNLTKEKIQADLLKYRQIFEEVQKRIKQDTQIDIAATGLDENVSIKGLFKVLWTPSEENMFQHAMVETVFKLEQIQSEQLARFDDLANSEFEALTGLCINEAKQLKDKLNATTTELLIANQHRLSSEAQLSMLRQQLNDSESARLELDAKHSLATKSFDEREASMTTIIGNLERELSSRDTVISQLEESVKRIEETSSTQLKQQESEMRTSYLRAMKDNALLIKSFQDLERVHRAAVEKISSQASALQQLELNTAQLVEAHTEEKRQFIETISDTESKLRDTSTKLSACEQSLKETKIELEESLNLEQQLRSHLQSSAEKVQILQADYEKVCFERDSLEEDNENNMVLVDTLRIERENFIEVMTNLENQNGELTSKIAAAEEIIAKKDDIILNTQDQIAKLSQKLATKEAECGQLVSRCDELAADLEIKDTMMQAMEHKLNSLCDEVTRLTSDLGASIKASDELQSQVNSLTENLAAAEQNLLSETEVRVSLSETLAQAKLESQTLKSELEVSMSENKSLERQIVENKMVIEGLRTDMESAHTTNDMLRSTVEAVSANFTAATSELSDIKDQLAAESQELASAYRQNADQVNELTKLREIIDESTATITSMADESSKKSVELATIQAQATDYCNQLTAMTDDHVKAVADCTELREHLLVGKQELELKAQSLCEMQNSLDVCQSQLHAQIAINQELTTNLSALAAVQTQYEELQSKADSLGNELLASQQEVVDSQLQLTDLRQQLNFTSIKLGNVNTLVESLTKLNEDAETDKQGLLNAKQFVEADLNHLRTNHEALQKETDRLKDAVQAASCENERLAADIARSHEARSIAESQMKDSFEKENELKCRTIEGLRAENSKLLDTQNQLVSKIEEAAGVTEELKLLRIKHSSLQTDYDDMAKSYESVQEVCRPQQTYCAN
jgi:kinesin family protein 15